MINWLMSKLLDFLEELGGNKTDNASAQTLGTTLKEVKQLRSELDISADELALLLSKRDRRIDNDETKGNGKRKHDINDVAGILYRSGF